MVSDNDKKVKEEILKQGLVNLGTIALKLFNLMKEGETIEVGIISKPVIVTPHTKSEVRCLLITKPSRKSVLTIKQK